MPDGNYTIRIGSTADTGGMTQAETALKRCDVLAHNFIDTMKLGVGIDLGGKLVQSVAALPDMFGQLVQRGEAFNAELSNGEAGMAKIIGRFQGLNEEAAKDAGAKAMAKIIELEPSTSGTLSSLVAGFNATAASSLSAGLTVQQNIDLVAKFANALSNIGVDQFQLPQELRSILSGNITADSALAKVLQISNEDIAKAKQAGDLYGFLVDKVGSLGAAGDTNAVRLSTLTSAIDKLLATATKPIFDTINDGLLTLTTELNKPETANALKQLGFEIAGLVGDGVKLTAWAIQNADALVAVGKAAGTVAVAFAAWKLAELAVGLGGLTAAFIKNIAGLEAETAALVANTAAQVANAEAAAGGGVARGAVGKRGFLSGKGAGAALQGGAIIDTAIVMAANALDDATNTRVDTLNGTQADMGKIQSKATSDFKGIDSRAAKEKFINDLLDQQEQLTVRRNAADSENAAAIDATVTILSSLVDRAIQINDLKLEALETEKKISAEKAKQAELDAKGRANAATLAASEAARAAAQANDELRAKAEAGDINAVGPALAKKQAEYDALKAAFLHPSGDLQKPTPTAAQVTTAGDQLAELKQLRDAALAANSANAEKQGKENNDAAVKGLQDEQTLLEAIAEQRIATVEAAGGKESEIAAKRAQIEAEIAADRLRTEDRIGLLQGESDTAREARHVAAATADIQRAGELARLARETADQRARDDFDRGVGKGGIDARSQRQLGLGGELLVDRGQLQAGATRSALGTALGPSTLPPSLRTAVINPAALLPPTSAPGATPNGRAGAEGARVAEALKTSTDAIEKTSAAVVTAVKAHASTTVATNSHIVALLEQATTVLAAVDRELANVKGRLDNTSTD